MLDGKKPAAELLKVTGDAMLQALAPGVETAFSLLQKGADALANYVSEANGRRYEEFCRAAFEGNIFPENGADLTAGHLISMLRACTADIENEKASLYGHLASAFATNRVPEPYRHPLMSALSALTYSQVDRLRRVWVATQYRLIPARGPGQRRPREFLEGTHSVIDGWDTEALMARSMAKEGSITKLGEYLVLACFGAAELTPKAIGERAWASNLHLPIVSFELASDAVLALASELGDAARQLCIQTSGVFAPRDQQAADGAWFGAHGCTVVLVDLSGAELAERRQVFSKMLDRGHHLVIAFLGQKDEQVLQAFPSAVIVELKPSDIDRADRIMARVGDILKAELPPGE
jgi:hypothetical protein